MSEMSNEEAIHQLKCQYFQLVEPKAIEFPPLNVLIQPEFQEAVYGALFSPTASANPPPERYTARVLKQLISVLESSPLSTDCEISSSILELYTTLLHTPARAPSPTSKIPVTYTLPAPLPAITLLETPYIISGHGTTGLRTWEASLALSEHLLAHPTLITSTTNILELGAGTGLVSLVAARMGAHNVIATDGDDGVCDALRANAEVNRLGDVVKVEKRWWGEEEGIREKGVDLVLGADVTYDAEAMPALVKELEGWLGEDAGVKVVVSATVRNEVTFDAFRRAAGNAGLRLRESVWRQEKKVFWFTPKAEIRIVEVERAEQVVGADCG